ncbi:MAG: hypothetical protein CFE21_18810 [Bacteroidetes bacterium B1(2017)]|nr:MAG: hypothetical protein CFE21_18810 [Bacteroidetes bacterium B1(2017)]
MLSSRTSFKLMFYINNSRPNKRGECPINLRITINGDIEVLSTQRTVSPDIWDSINGHCFGKTAKAVEVNKHLDLIKVNAYNKYNEILGMYEMVTAKLLKDAILCIGTAQSKTLCDLWEDHVKSLHAMIGKGTSYGNYHKYRTALRYMREFLLLNYRIKDVPVKLVNNHMVTKFDIFLQTNKKCCGNTAKKYLQNFKTICNIALKNGWLKLNPFAFVKLTLEEVDRPYLTEEELNRIIGLEILMPRLEVVRDLFVFASFTGLSYADLFKLDKSMIEMDNKGVFWIRTRRQKTRVKTQVPLLSIPVALLEKYCDLSLLSAEDKVLPVMSNQKINAYLKEIQTFAKIEKELTFHVARHTFATTVTMFNGVPIESVSKMLGHKNITTTQHYARIVDLKVGNDMVDLANKLGGRFGQPSAS